MNGPQTPIPPGYQPLPFDPAENFVGANGPLYRRIDGGDLLLGFRVGRRHCNLAMMCHGGMIATLADMQISLGARHAAGLQIMLPTISLTIDFLRGAPVGAWVGGRTTLLRETGGLVFAQCILWADDEPVARASGVLKKGPKVENLSRVTA